MKQVTDQEESRAEKGAAMLAARRKLLAAKWRKFKRRGVPKRCPDLIQTDFLEDLDQFQLPLTE